ncbi:MAG: hypothetical protein Q9225_001311 [Loekoesia sp. 1 TL-2023]
MQSTNPYFSPFHAHPPQQVYPQFQSYCQSQFQSQFQSQLHCQYHPQFHPQYQTQYQLQYQIQHQPQYHPPLGAPFQAEVPYQGFPPEETIMQSSSSSTHEATPPAKNRLTEEQRKRNHIKSETARRTALRAEFTEMIKLLPEVDEDAYRNEGFTLGKFMEYAKEKLAKRKALIKELESRGMDVEKDLQISKDERGLRVIPPAPRKNGATGPKRKRQLS